MSALIIIAAITGLVWGAVILQRVGLLAGGLAVLLVGSCFGHPYFHTSLGPLPVTCDRLLLAVLLIVMILGRRTAVVHSRPLTWNDGLLAALVGMVALSMATHDWRIDDSRPAAMWIIFYAMPAGVYLLARQSVLGEKKLQGMFAAFAIFGVYLAATGIAETQELWQLVYPRYIVSDEYPEYLGRARGPFLSPVACGMYLTAAIVGALAWWPRLSRVGRAGVLAVVALLLVGTYWTLTRSVWGGAGMAVAIVVGATLPKSFRMPLLIAGTLSLLVVVAVKWDSLRAFKRDKDVSVHHMAQSAELRPVLAAVAWHMFLDRPLLGCGFGQYKHYDVDYWRVPNAELPLERAKPYVQHNVFLAMLTETGLLGVGLLTVLLALWMRAGWRLWRDVERPLAERQAGLLLVTLVTAYVMNGMFHDVSIMPMINMLLFFSGGVTQGLLLNSRAAGGAFADSLS